MPIPNPNQFWTLVGESGLVDADRLAALRSEFEIESLSPAATPEAVTEVIAKWLVRRKVLTLWQVRRIVRGDRGPFFIGDYRLLERLEKDAYQGRTMGHLFRARHEPSGRVVLLMVLDAERCRDLEVWTDIVRRTTVASRTADPTLARTWALEQSGGQRFIVCEDVGGTSLTAELAARGPRPVAEVGPLVLAIARAVAELHRLGVVHGGISLEALKREPVAAAEPATGRVRLLQFPLVADPHVVPPRPVIDTPEGMHGLGTRVAFLAPELLLPGAVCDPRSDVYAIGCVLHALLAGALPCWQGDAERTLAQAAFVGPPPLGPPQVPVEVATLVSYLVARDPAARYQCAAEAADAIAACLGLPPVSPSLPAQQPFIGPAAAAAPEPPVAAPSPAAAVLSASRAAEPVVIMTPAPPPPRVKQTASRWIVASLGLAALAATGLFMAFGTRTPVVVPKPLSRASDADVAASEKSRVEQPSDAEAASAAEPAEATLQGRPAPRLVDAADVPSVPWASPTSGSPPTLQHLPPGSQLVLLARPADLFASDDGRQFVKALGSRAEQALAGLAAACGCPPEGIEFVQAGWQADPAARPDAVAMGYAVRGTQAFPVAHDEAAREEAWGKTTPREVDDETIHVGPALAYWLPRVDGGRVLVAAPEKLLREIVAADAAGRERTTAADWRDRLQATLPPDLEELVGMLDEDRQVTLFGAPSYLLHDGRPVFAGPLAKLVEPLNAVLGEGSAAAAISLHCGDTFYLELDAIPGRSGAARGEAAALADRIAAIADTVEAYCEALDPHPYGRKVVRRLPGMVRILAANLRTAVEGKGVVVNCHLPRQAGHNLALASELAVEQSPGVGGAVVTEAIASASQSAVERLAKRISLTFARDTLEKSIQMLAEEIGLPIEILGRDLELEGITKNQSFGLDEQDQPAEAILGTILARSNPDGKLVYVVRRRDGAESIEITTRAAAAKRGDDLPAMFATGPQAAQEEESPK
jgi:serine/threonine protein kinase